jgi:rhodanese-related sulfurtransferase
MKTSSDYLSEANAVVEKIEAKHGVEKHSSGEALFIDVRDSADINSTGTILNCLRIPRGFIEFAADDSSSLHNKKLLKDKEIILVCGAGGMAALSGKTLIEMGYRNVKNVGGFSDWVKAGGPTED